MATQKVLIAADGRTVHLPDGSLWPKEGLPDPDTHFTRRRVADSDLIETTVEVAAPEAPADPPPAQTETPAETLAEAKRSPAKKPEGDK